MRRTVFIISFVIIAIFGILATPIKATLIDPISVTSKMNSSNYWEVTVTYKNPDTMKVETSFFEHIKGIRYDDVPSDFYTALDDLGLFRHAIQHIAGNDTGQVAMYYHDPFDPDSHGVWYYDNNILKYITNILPNSPIPFSDGGMFTMEHSRTLYVYDTNNLIQLDIKGQIAPCINIDNELLVWNNEGKWTFVDDWTKHSSATVMNKN